jgi:hypothetical protein
MIMDKKRIIGVLLLCFVLIVVAGCAGLTTSSKKEGASEEKKKVAPLSPTYSEFEDVRIPREMDLDRSESVVYESHNLRMGVLYYSAKGELPETVEFFKEHMTKDGWKLINSFQHKSYILNFVKSDRSCIIIVEKKTTKTHVQIWLGPLQQETKYTKKKSKRR